MFDKFCESCGSTLEEGAKFCAACGASAPVNSVPEQVPQNNGTSSQNYVPPVQQYSPPAQQFVPPVQQSVPPVQQSNNPVADTSPMKVWQYILMLILLAIPIVGLVLTFVWSFSSSVNINKRNYARALLILGVIAAAVSVILSIIYGTSISSFLHGGLGSL